MHVKILGLLAVGLLAGPLAANAQAVTYDFSAGTFGNQGSGSIGEVYGTFTFDFSQANRALTVGTVGSQVTPWSVTSTAGPLFTMNVWSATTGRLIYSGGSPETSEIDGNPTEGRGYTGFGAGESNSHGRSSITMFYEPPSPGFLSNGLPLTTDLVETTGQIVTSTANFDFQLNGLTRAPEIDPSSAAGGLTLLLGSLVALRGRRPPNRVAA
jgi:hypothetical protein